MSFCPKPLTWLLLTVAWLQVSGASTAPIILNHESIITLTYKNNPGITAAQHKLKSAEYNYRLFEREYTKFTPFIFSSRLFSDQDKNASGDMSVGVRKEFFAGSSFSMTTGHESDISVDLPDHRQYLRGNAEFPLFSSNRRLSRLTKRTFEENELYSANLNYVETIQEVIRHALFSFYQNTYRSNVVDMLNSYHQELTQLLTEPRITANDNDQRQLQDEINSVATDIQAWDSRVTWVKINLAEEMGVPTVDSFIIQRVPYGFDKKDFFGHHYFKMSYSEILKQAMQNNTMVKVFDRVITNAREKKRLAEKGKWDIFMSLDGEYSYAGLNTGEEHGYNMGVGLNINRFDHKVLNLSRLKAVCDIAAIEAEIKELEAEIASEVQLRKDKIDNIQEQYQTSLESRRTRRESYRLKLDHYQKGTESIDNLLQAFREMVETEAEFNRMGIEHYYLIVDLDTYCGVYFDILGLKLE